MMQIFHLVMYSAWAEVKAQNSRLLLGVAWWVIEPLIYMAVFYFVFGILFQRGGPGYAAFLLTGLVAYRWFDSSVRLAMDAIVRNANLIQQVYVPKYAFPLSSSVAAMVKFLPVFAVLAIFVMSQGHMPNVHWLALPLIITTEFLLALLIGTISAMAVPFLPDLRIIISNGLTLFLFLSGVFYSAASIPAPWDSYFYLNPMAVIIESFRKVMLEAAWPPWGALFTVGIASIIGIAILFQIHKKLDLIYAKRIP